MENFNRIESLVSVLDKRIKAQIPELNSLSSSLTPARNDFFQLKMFIDILWNAIHILKTAIREESPDGVRVYINDKSSDNQTPWAGWEPEESEYATALTLPGWNIPIDIQRSKDVREKNEGKNNSHSEQFLQKRWVALKKTGARSFRSSTLLDFFIIGTRMGTAAAITSMWHSLRRSGKKPILIYGTGYPGAYNWDDALPALYQEGVGPVFRITDQDITSRLPDLTQYIHIATELCESSQELRMLSRFMGIDTSRFLVERVSQSIGCSIAQSLTAYSLCRDILNQHHIRCLLFSVRMRPSGNAIVQAAHDAGIPVIGWQHGAAGYCYHPMMAYLEYLNTDYHLVFGKGVAESFQKTLIRLGMECSTKFVPVGSSSLDLLLQKTMRKIPEYRNRSVLYITTMYLNNRYYFSDRLNHSASDEILWDIQKNVLDLAHLHKDVKFTVKLHHSAMDYPLVQQYAADKRIQNVTFVINEKTVPELIDEAGIILFDLNSTGLLQALCTKKPVFVFTGLDNHEIGTINLLKKRAFVYDRPDSFIGAIDTFLCGKITESVVDFSNTEFLLKYGTYLNDGLSGQRAAQCVNRIITQNDN